MSNRNKPFRFADKPTTSTPMILPQLKDGEWLAQLKFDGWRTYVCWDGKAVTLTSRHRKPIPAAPWMIAELTRSLSGASPLTFDAEWMGRRDDHPEALILFDLIEYGSDSPWVGDARAADRFDLLRSVVSIQPPSPVLCVVPSVYGGYGAFFELSKRTPGCEGIVLKRKASRFIGSVRKSVDNPDWLKVKFREGFDGQHNVA